MNKKIIVSITLLSILALLFAVPWYIEYKTEKDHQRAMEQLELEAELKEEQEQKIYECLDMEYEAYIDRWKSTCTKLELPENNDGLCDLPNYLAYEYETGLEESRMFCVELYK